MLSIRLSEKIAFLQSGGKIRKVLLYPSLKKKQKELRIFIRIIVSDAYIHNMKRSGIILEWGLSLLELFFPRICAVCSKSLFQHEQVICTPCRLHLPETGYHTDPDNKVAAIFWGRVRFEHCSSYLHYRKGNSVQKLIHQLKYKGRQDIGEYLGSLYGKKLAASGVLIEIDGIVPVPLHKKKERTRGYNQSLSIARGLAAELSKPVLNNVVVRTTFNESQTKKDRYSRWENAKDRFTLSGEIDISGKHILFVDDVITTGSTIEALANAFSNADNVKLSAVSIGSAY